MNEINVIEKDDCTTVEFRGEERELLTRAKEAYGFKDIPGMLGFLLNLAIKGDGRILQCGNPEGKFRFFVPVSLLEEMTPESEKIYIDLINIVNIKTFLDDYPIRELESLSKSQKASVKYRLAGFVQQSLQKV